MAQAVDLLGSVTERTTDRLRDAGVAAPVSSPVADEFLADVCHRVRTPLNGILGSLELLLGEEISDDARELAAAAYESALDLHRVFESELDAAVAASPVILRPLTAELSTDLSADLSTGLGTRSAF
jgi:signal transduction histidine kinase